MLYSHARLISVASFCCVMTACGKYGPDAGAFPPAQQPAGISAQLGMDGDTLQVELLAIEANSLIVVVDRLQQHRLAGRLVRIGFARIENARFMHAGDFRYNFFRFALPGFGGERREMPTLGVTSGSTMSEDDVIRVRLRLLSRFPQGIDDELLGRLQTVYGALVVWEPEVVRGHSPPAWAISGRRYHRSRRDRKRALRNAPPLRRSTNLRAAPASGPSSPWNKSPLHSDGDASVLDAALADPTL